MSRRAADPDELFPAGTTAADVATLVGGRLDGRADLPLIGAAGLEEAAADQLAFIVDAARAADWGDVSAGAALISEGLEAIGPGCRVPHVGGVVIEDDVEIGANSCVDRAMFGVTRIGGGVGIVDHMTIGRGASLAAFSGVVKDVQPGAAWGGVPAGPLHQKLREAIALRKLPTALKGLTRSEAERCRSLPATETMD